MVKIGADAVGELVVASRSDGERNERQPTSVETRRGALWALTRIGNPAARAAIREALSDVDPSVRMVAAHCVGLERDALAHSALTKMVIDDDPPLRLKAAEALGRLGRPDAVDALLQSVARGVSGRFLEHALIYAMIRIADREATLVALDHANPRVKRAGLIALDQMTGGDLTRDSVAPLLDTDDPDLQQAALDVISRHDGWSDEIVALLGDLLQRKKLAGGQERSLTGSLLAFCDDDKVQQLVVAALERPATPLLTRKLLFQVMARCRLSSLPEEWQAKLAGFLAGSDSDLAREALAVIRTRNIRDFDKQLADLGRRSEMSAELRVAALDALSVSNQRLEPDQFQLLSANLSDEANPLLRVTAARALGAFTLGSDQLIQLAGHVADGGPLTAPLVTPAFAQSRDSQVGHKFVAALNKSLGASAITADELRGLLKRYPPEVHSAAAGLLKKLEARQQGREDYLAELTGQILNTEGRAERGERVFFSKKAGCYGCHRLGEKGGAVGPDLSRIGRIRWPRDLLEAIVFPSSTIVPDYRSFTIATKEGQVINGMIVRESSDAIYLRTTQLAELRVARDDVELIRPSTVSIMPEGMEKTMSAQELADLLEFLYQQR